VRALTKWKAVCFVRAGVRSGYEFLLAALTSTRPYRGLGELSYPFHDRTVLVT